MKKKIRCFWLLMGVCGAMWAQNGGQYLQQPLPKSFPPTELCSQTLPVADRWWLSFDDATLDSLIAVAGVQNVTAQEAQNRIEQARLSLQSARGAYAPSVSVGAGWLREKTSSHTTGSPQSWLGYYNATASMSWEIDVAGSIRNRVKAGRANYAASREAYAATMVSLAAQVATNYFYLRESQQELAVLRDNLASQQAVVAITEARFKTGLASALDVAQAKSVYYSTKASIPQTELAVAQYTNVLAVLLGLFPEQLQGSVRRSLPLPEYVELVGVGLPAQLIRRRPDIREAEQTIAAQAATLGVSKSDLWPKFYLTGSIGWAANKPKQMGKSESLTWQIAPTVSWTIFNGLQNVRSVQLARQQLDEAVLAYNQTVLTAVQEVETAMSAYQYSVKQMVTYKEVVNAGERTLALSLELYKQGLTTFTDVLDAQRSLLSYQNGLVQARAYTLICLVQMYQALGGGWNESAVDN